MKVLAGTITSSPGPRPSARTVSSMASVPLATPMQWGTPQKRAKAASNSRTCGPRMKAVSAITRAKPARDLVGDLGVLRLEIDEGDGLVGLIRSPSGRRSRSERSRARRARAPRAAPLRPSEIGGLPVAMHSRK